MMQITQRVRRNSLTSNLGRLFAAVLFLLALSPGVSQADQREARNTRRAMKGTAGTAFNLTPEPTFPWQHEVRGIVQLSNLGNCTVRFAVKIDAGSACEGGHIFCLSGKLTIKTLAGDELQADVVGWADADPNDPKPSPTMNVFHYDVTLTGGTGTLQNARGSGEINGAFFFCEGDCFCDSYQGVATWTYDGMLQLPRRAGH